MRLSYSDAEFLINLGRMDEAEAYIRSRADQLNGDRYSSLLPLGEAMGADHSMLCASVIYRELLDSILRRAQSGIYGHGVRWLDRLAKSVSDWGEFTTHDTGVAELRHLHGRKSSFWSQHGK